MRLALRALGQEPPAGARLLESQLDWALANFEITRISRGPVAVGVHPP
jgi:hypothetical protein